MTAYTGRFTPSSAGGNSARSTVTFGADISQEPVFLSASVTNSRDFARLMLALGDVVRLNEGRREVDHTQYQEWVRGEYLKELGTEQALAAAESALLLEERAAHHQVLKELEGRVRRLMPEHDVFREERYAFWRWLYAHNRAAWLILDPIVSVQPDAVFFEAFSQDESTYARVRVPTDLLALDRPMRPGTTNIDFSIALEREFARTRTYRPLQLTVGAQEVTLATKISSIIEKKIDLPESWVRGLVEVQSALAIAPITLTLRSGFVADIISRLQSEREKEGPRALLFRLIPGEPVAIEIQPWGETFIDHSSVYRGERRRDIRVWGRRRLRVLNGVLPHVPVVEVSLIDSGMPSFWNVSLGGFGLTIGLSGWTAQDWAGRARFSALTPASVATDEDVAQVAPLLQQQLSLSADELATTLNVAPGRAKAVLQRLCLAGQAMFDPESSRYRWRALFPQIDLSLNTETGREERKGVELAQAKAVRLQQDSLLEGGLRRVVATVIEGDSERETMIETDVDGRVTYAQCDCSHFRHHKMRQGPCRHIVATTLAESMP